MFSAVRFLLVGFDSVSETQYRDELLRRGAVDVGRYDADICTHVIVSGRVYDDPVCVAARSDGKILVTEMWIDDSLDLGRLADASKVLYRPVKDLNGIPGSQSLHICLTGYQRQDRDDIMKMVSLMGARFSKPLIANQVTHLVCYKFEGEKYELAKKVNIKLVNHRWLEDCLKAWKILPIDNYTKSGWELEVLEAEAKDSDEETENPVLNNSMHRSGVRSFGLAGGIPKAAESNFPTPSRQFTTINKNSVAKTPVSAGHAFTNGRSLGTPLKSTSIQAFDECVSGSKTANENTSWTDQNHVTENAVGEKKLFYGQDSDLKEHELLSTSKIGSKLSTTDKYASVSSFPRKSQKNETSPEEQSVNYCKSTIDFKDTISRVNFDASPPPAKESGANDEPVKVQSPCTSDQHKVAEIKSNLPQKRRISLSSLSSKPPKLEARGSRPMQGQLQAIEAPEKTSFLPHIEVDAMLIDADQPSNDLGFSDTTPNQQAAPSPSGVILVNKLGNEQVLDDQKGKVANLSLLKLSDTSIVDHDMVTDFHSAGEQMPVDDANKIVSNTTNQLCTLVIDNKGINETAGEGKGATIDVVLEELHVDSKAYIDEAAEKDNIHLLAKKTAQASKNENADGELSPSSNSKTKLSGTTASVDENNINTGTDDHTKMDVANSRLNSKLKKFAPKGRKGKDSTNAVNSHTKVMVTEDDTEVAEHQTAISLNKDAISKVVADQQDSISKASSDSVKESVKVVTGQQTKKAVAKRFAPKGRKGKNLTNEPEPVHSHSKEMVNEDDTEIAEHQMATSLNKDAISEALPDSVKEPVKVVTDQQTKKTAPKKFAPKSQKGKIFTNEPVNSHSKEMVTEEDTEIAEHQTALSINKDAISEALLDSVKESVKVVTEQQVAISGALSDSAKESVKLLTDQQTKKAVAKRQLNSKSKKSAADDGKERKISDEVVNSHPKEILENNKESGTITTSVNMNSTIMSEASTDLVKDSVKVANNQRTKKAVAKRQLNSKSQKSAADDKKEKHFNVMTVNSHSKEIDMEGDTKMAEHPSTSSVNKDTVLLPEASMDSNKENVLENGNRVVPSKMFNRHNSSIQEQNCSNTMEIPNYEKIVKSEPVQFILRGNRTQRKEFKSIIRRLKGKVCRDSHQWSYQATHFIAPELRRTEKFFAAAASGRWILKAEYLTASNEAGKFLDEEPFEWHKKGLTEDGAVSLEAPRKWRLLKERTGHGAFYGMKVVIYGECIVPTLDTLKRVVKAGDGVILATSPPYTRFLKSGVDYAIVSSSMPRVDSWIQEFLRHEIPCVTSDYLVEYVCKPGCSLEKHVLYKTHPWAERSLKRLLDCSKEISKEAVVASEEGIDDLKCSKCRSSEREEVMLICGNEDGTLGCGMGIHIDCCKPPLQTVPDEDWFCLNCRNLSVKTPVKKRKRKSSS